MDVFKAVETYITKMVSEPSAMKVLLLDTHTVRGCVPFISAAQKPYGRFTDTNCLLSIHSVNSAIAPSLPDRQDRQQETGSDGTHEMRLFPPAERRQPRSVGSRVERAEVRGILSLSVR
jgi:hypothetical protein